MKQVNMEDSSVSATSASPKIIEFGHSVRSEFLFAPTYTNLNHGSYGTYPTTISKHLHHLQSLTEARPDKFIRGESFIGLNSSRSAVATLLNCPLDTVVFIPNATTGVNLVLRNIKWEKGDTIIYFSTVYGACEKTVDYICETTLAESSRISMSHPISDSEVIRKFEHRIGEINSNSGKKAKLAIFDTVSSLPGIRVPFEKLVDVCRKEDVLSVIDGAHGIGHIPLDLTIVDPDFFTSNCHKWLFTPRGCAVFYVPERNQHLVRSSLPTSHGFVPIPSQSEVKIQSPFAESLQSPFVALFEIAATIDNSPYLCVAEAIRYRKEVCGGEQRITDYCRNVAREGGKAAAGILGTEVMDNKEGTLTDCALSNVRLPLTIGEAKGQIKENHISRVGRWMEKILEKEHDTFIPIYFYEGSLWARFSGQIYLEVSDVVWGAKLLKELCDRVENGEYLMANAKI